MRYSVMAACVCSTSKLDVGGAGLGSGHAADASPEVLQVWIQHVMRHEYICLSPILIVCCNLIRILEDRRG